MNYFEEENKEKEDLTLYYEKIATDYIKRFENLFVSVMFDNTILIKYKKNKLLIKNQNILNKNNFIGIVSVIQSLIIYEEIISIENSNWDLLNTLINKDVDKNTFMKQIEEIKNFLVENCNKENIDYKKLLLYYEY